MANIYTGVEQYGYEGGIFKRVSWGALFAGFVVALVIMLLLTLLGMGIGLGTINPATEQKPFGGFGIGASIWLAISALIAFFAGGWTTAKLAGSVRGLNGILHSIVMWGLVTLVSFWLMTTAIGMLIGGAATVVGRSVSAISSGIAAVAPEVGQRIQQELAQRGISVDQLVNEAMQLAGAGQKQAGGAAAGGAETQNVQQELRQSLRKIFSTGGTVSQADRENVVNILVTRAGMARPEAERTVNNWIQQYQLAAQSAQQFSQQAMQTTEQAMDALGRVGIWLFILLILEAAAAAFGGWLGASKEHAEPVR